MPLETTHTSTSAPSASKIQAADSSAAGTSPARAASDWLSRFRSLAARPALLLWAAALAALFVYAVFTRFYMVSDKPLHHDESLFAYYAYFLSRGHGYDYMPILHGPVLQFLSASIFLLFGSNDFTMRLPAVLGGLALFAVLWFWRSELGRRGLLAAFALAAVSPTLTYYSRFLRNDIPYLAVTLWCALCVIRAFQTSRPRYVWGAVLSAFLMFSMMESSIFFFAACLGFLGVAVGTDFLTGLFASRNTVRAGSIPGPATPGGKTAATAPPRIEPLAFVWKTALVAALIVATAAWFYNRMWAATIPVHAPLTALASAAGVPLSESAARLVLLGLLFPAVWMLCLAAGFNLRRPSGRTGLLYQFLRTVADNRWAVIGAFALATALYTLFFTTFFTNVQAMGFDHREGARDFRGPLKPLTPVQIYRNTWDYWWDQHKLHRIKGPFHYYLPILLMYELPAVCIVIGGWARTLLTSRSRALHLALFLGPQLLLALVNAIWLNAAIDKAGWERLDAKFHITSPVHFHLVLLYVQLLTHMTGLLLTRGRRVEAFLTFWSVTSLFAYSYAGEKVPWLAVHVAGPLFLLAGLTVQRLAREAAWSRGRRIAAVAFVGVTALWQVRSQMSVAFLRPASPAERIIYNHTSPDVTYAAERIASLGHSTNLGKDLPLHITGEPVWPLYWYLREMPNAFPPTTEGVEETSRALVIADWHIVTASDNMRQNYSCERLKVREWWEAPGLDVAAMFDLFRILTPRESRRSGDNALRWQFAVAEWRRLWRYLLYREIWMDPDNSDWSNGANEFGLCVRKDLNERELSIDQLNSLPKRPDIPRFP